MIVFSRTPAIKVQVLSALTFKLNDLFVMGLRKGESLFESTMRILSHNFKCRCEEVVYACVCVCMCTFL